MAQTQKQPGRRRIGMRAPLLGAILVLGGCACCGPRFFGEPGREVGFQPIGQQRTDAEYTRDLERRLSDPRRDR